MPTPAKKLYIKTHGCQMNEYDSSRIRDLLQLEHDLIATENENEADVLLLNTCSIREKAQEKVFHQLGRWRLLKEQQPNIIIGVGGCVASQEGSAITDRAPFVDLVFGPQTLHRVPDMISQRQPGIPVVDVTFPEIEKFDRLPEPSVDGPSAFVSIMEGCSKYCTFCVVPYTRGEEVSRRFEDILTEAVQLAEQGVKEITLLGQNVNAYRINYDGVEADLAMLIETLAEIPQIERIRFTTSHPNEMSDRLIDCYANVSKLAVQLHLPVQSGSDRILMAMKRNHTALQYKSTIRKLRTANPDITLTSDFIVGFPGETEKEFEATLKLIEEIGFDYSFSFLYSPRPGTPAAFLEDTTPETVKKARLAKLQALNLTQAEQISRAMLGTTQRVLIENVSTKFPAYMIGKTDNNRIVDITVNKAMLNTFATVNITDVSNPRRLKGEII